MDPVVPLKPMKNINGFPFFLSNYHRPLLLQPDKLFACFYYYNFNQVYFNTVPNILFSVFSRRFLAELVFEWYMFLTFTHQHFLEFVQVRHREQFPLWYETQHRLQQYCAPTNEFFFSANSWRDQGHSLHSVRCYCRLQVFSHCCCGPSAPLNAA